MEQGSCSNSGQRLEVIVAGDEGSVRLDRMLAVRLPELSRSRLKALILAGSVTVKSAPVRDPAYHVNAGDTITIDVPEAVAPEPAGEDIALDIVHEDDDIIVIDKPKGLVVHPAAGHETGTLVNALIAHCGTSLSGIGGVRRPGIVHRLDKDTTGLMVAAKNDRAHKSLTEQFADHGRTGAMRRGYMAFVWDLPNRQRGTIDAPIDRHPTHDYKWAVVEGGKASITHYETIEAFRAATLLEIHLETGRTHQIRVHMTAMKHPCVGDLTYGADPTISARLGLTRQWLHAVELAFDHPGTGHRVTFTSPYAPDLQNALDVVSAES